MEFFWIALVLVVVVVVGNALVLLRTAKKPKIPDSYQPKSEQDDDGGW
jgi:hypothetical protein